MFHDFGRKRVYLPAAQICCQRVLRVEGPRAVSFNGDARLANPVAALPSLHAAWPFMLLLLLWPVAGRYRWLLVGYNAVMIFVLVYGAEHYVSDILLGWVYALVVFLAFSRYWARRENAAVEAP